MWTIVPDMFLFSKDDPKFLENQYDEIEFSNKILVTRKLNEKQYEIVRIITTDPRDYLNEKIQPGSIINSNLF
ncbi:YlzJ-like family protein [Anaerosinus gibii]|uniref:YlzJ-like family protein n=1 Tax=Selenobaculum gibii TaxID=3054208 RepID=A0A9Y2AL43_9FIRM|nr:YlzJ-like family protein [Selenobaculum gbiensis]WIW71863.1 YlzJ-like family protein [Selenobaculum gbiensis]